MDSLRRYTSLQTECLRPPNAQVEGLVPRAMVLGGAGGSVLRRGPWEG